MKTIKKHRTIASLVFLVCLTFLSGCAYLYDVTDYKVKFIDGTMKGTVKVETMPRGYSVGDTVYIYNCNAVS